MHLNKYTFAHNTTGWW